MDQDLMFMKPAKKSMQSVSEHRPAELTGLATRLQLMQSYRRIVTLSLRRVRPRRRDLESLLLILLFPALYIIRFRGELRTPIGKVRIPNVIVLRSFTYGFFKSYFCYGYTLGRLTRASPFSTVVDVGANLGDFSLAIRHMSTRVLAIEPGGDNFVALCENLLMNKAVNIKPVRAAAHHREEMVSLGGWNSDLRVLPYSGGEMVKGVPLDTLLQSQGITSVDLMKIDVQGHERSVLGGLSQLLGHRQVRLIVVEVHPDRDINASNIVSLMKQFGYELLHIDPFYGQSQLYFHPLS